MTFIRKKTITAFMVLFSVIAYIASAEARACPAAGSNATTFFGVGAVIRDPLVACRRLLLSVALVPSLLILESYMQLDKSWFKLFALVSWLIYLKVILSMKTKGKPNPPESPMDDALEYLQRA